MFVLTREEKRVVCFVVLAILIGLGVKEYRRRHPPLKPVERQQGAGHEERRRAARASPAIATPASE